MATVTAVRVVTIGRRLSSATFFCLFVCLFACLFVFYCFSRKREGEHGVHHFGCRIGFAIKNTRPVCTVYQFCR